MESVGRHYTGDTLPGAVPTRPGAEAGEDGPGPGPLPPKSPRMTNRKQALPAVNPPKPQPQHRVRVGDNDHDRGQVGLRGVDGGYRHGHQQPGSVSVSESGRGHGHGVKGGIGNRQVDGEIREDGYPPLPSAIRSPGKLRFGRKAVDQQVKDGPPSTQHQQKQRQHQHQQRHQQQHQHQHSQDQNQTRGNIPPAIQTHPPSSRANQPSTAPLPLPHQHTHTTNATSPTRTDATHPTPTGIGGTGKSPLLERLKQTFIAREPMSKTWARKSYQDELDSVSQIDRIGGVHVGIRTGGGSGGGIENQSGSGRRSAPASISDRGDRDIESQSQHLHHNPTNTNTNTSRPVSIYASPAAVAQFKALPPVGPGGDTIPAHPAMRI